MGRLCGLLGHKREQTRLETRKVSRDGRVTLTVKEYWTCSRCDDEELLSENRGDITPTRTDSTDTADNSQALAEVDATPTPDDGDSQLVTMPDDYEFGEGTPILPRNRAAKVERIDPSGAVTEVETPQNDNVEQLTPLQPNRPPSADCDHTGKPRVLIGDGGTPRRETVRPNDDAIVITDAADAGGDDGEKRAPSRRAELVCRACDARWPGVGRREGDACPGCLAGFLRKVKEDRRPQREAETEEDEE